MMPEKVKAGCGCHHKTGLVYEERWSNLYQTYSIDRFKNQGRKRRFDALLDEIYKLPEPYASFEQYETFTHHDLVDLTVSELKTEMAKLRMRILIENKPADWFLERMAILNKRIAEECNG